MAPTTSSPKSTVSTVSGWDDMRSTIDDAREEIEEDDLYYCEDLHLIVDKVRFKVPRRIFNDSKIFRDMFRIPQSGSQTIDGSDRSAPLRLDGIEANEFRMFLRVLMPLQYGSGSVSTWEEWVSVLKLATLWQFDKIRDAAIKALSECTLDPVEKLILAHQYRVKIWIVPALNKLAQRPDTVKMTEANRLAPIVGWEYILRIHEVREMMPNDVRTGGFCPTYCTSCQRPAGTVVISGNINTRATYDFTPAIRKVFEV